MKSLDRMENYFLDGRGSLSNNAAENVVRPFTVGRENWLFADTPKGILHQRLDIVSSRPQKQMILKIDLSLLKTFFLLKSRKYLIIQK